MKTIRVTDATYRALAALATLPFHSNGTQQSDGSWVFPVDDETYDRLQENRLAGESEDDMLQRVIRHYQGQKPS